MKVQWSLNMCILCQHHTDRWCHWAEQIYFLPERYGWHFPYLWTASQGSWLLQQHLLNINGPNINMTESLFLLCGWWNHFSLRKGWTQWDNRLSRRGKKLEILVGRSSTTLITFTSACLQVSLKKFKCFKCRYAAQSTPDAVKRKMCCYCSNVT